MQKRFSGLASMVHGTMGPAGGPTYPPHTVCSTMNHLHFPFSIFYFPFPTSYFLFPLSSFVFHCTQQPPFPLGVAFVASLLLVVLTLSRKMGTVLLSKDRAPTTVE